MGANLPGAVYRARSESANTSSPPDVGFSSKWPRNIRPYSLNSQDPHPQEPQDQRHVEVDSSNRNSRDLFSAFSPAYFSPAVPRHFRAIWARHGGTTLRAPLTEPDVPPQYTHTNANSSFGPHSHLSHPPEAGGTGVYTHPLTLPFKVFFVYPPNDPVERALSGACVWPWDGRWVEACGRVERVVDRLEYVLDHEVEGVGYGDENGKEGEEDEQDEEDEEGEEEEEEEVDESGQPGENEIGLREGTGQLGTLRSELMPESALEGDTNPSSLGPRGVAFAPEDLQSTLSSTAAPSRQPPPHRAMESWTQGSGAPKSIIPLHPGLDSSSRRLAHSAELTSTRQPNHRPGPRPDGANSSSSSSAGTGSPRLATPTISPTLIAKLWDRVIADNGLEDLLPSSFDLRGFPPHENTAFLVLGGSGGIGAIKASNSRETGYDDEEVREGDQGRGEQERKAVSSAVSGAGKRTREVYEDQGNQEDQEDHEDRGNGGRREDRGDDEMHGNTEIHENAKKHDHVVDAGVEENERIVDYGESVAEAQASESTRPNSGFGLDTDVDIDIDIDIDIDMPRNEPEREQHEQHPSDARLRDLEREIWKRKHSAGIVSPPLPAAVEPSDAESRWRYRADALASIRAKRRRALAAIPTGPTKCRTLDTVETMRDRRHDVRSKAWQAGKRTKLVSDDSSDGEDSTPSPKPSFTMERIIEQEEEVGVGVGVGVEVEGRDSQTTKQVGKEQSRPAEAEGEGDRTTQSSRPSKTRTKIKRESGPPRW